MLLLSSRKASLHFGRHPFPVKSFNLLVFTANMIDVITGDSQLNLEHGAENRKKLIPKTDMFTTSGASEESMCGR